MARAAQRGDQRRTHVVRIFPNEASCLRLVHALAVEMHENWIEATRYLNMDLLSETRSCCCARWPDVKGPEYGSCCPVESRDEAAPSHRTRKTLRVSHSSHSPCC
jgi:hypothetical protein